MGDVIELPHRPAVSVVVPHVQTWRPYTMLYVGLVGLAGALLADTDAPAWRLCGAWLVPTLGWVAGHYGGDYFDRELDAVAKPHRPIPSGRMRAPVALAAMVACVAAGGVVATLLNWRTVPLVGVTLLTGASYSVVFKARGLAGNLVRGSLTAFAFLFGSMAVRHHPPAALAVVAAVFWLHDTASNLVGTLRDVDGDRAGGYATFAVRRGVTATLAVVVALSVVWLALAAVCPVPLGARAAVPGAFYGLLGGAGALAVAAVVTLVRAPRPLPPRPALRAHEILTLERVVLASAFAGLSAGLPVGLGLAVPAAVLSVLLQRSMRCQYEFGPRRGGAAARPS